MKDCEMIQPLLSGLMDGELTPEQSIAANQHLIHCAACRREYDDLVKACDPLRGLAFEEPDASQLERLWRSPCSRLARVGGLALLLCGWLTLLVFVTVEIARDRSAGLPLKLGLAGVALGFLVLLGAVALDRWLVSQHDPYKEVER